MSVQLTNLINLLTDFQGVERQIFIPDLQRQENDTEHSYNLTMAAWTIIAKDKLPLDIDLAIKYALVHDLVEVYAGDTFALDTTQTAHKPKLEHAALIKLSENELTSDLAELIQRYERMDDEESRFIYSLDKLMAALTIMHGLVPIWRQHGLTLQRWDNQFRPKIERSAHVKPYLDQFLTLAQQHPELFADNSE